MRHADPSTTRVYTQRSSKRLDSAVSDIVIFRIPNYYSFFINKQFLESKVSLNKRQIVKNF